MQYVTCLPVADNDGNSTENARSRFLSVLNSIEADMIIEKGHGIWFDESGKRYAERVMHVTIDFSDSDKVLAELAVKSFGIRANQLAMLWVPADSIAEEGHGDLMADDMAKRHGGSTLLGSGRAVSYNYSAFEQGKDY